MIDDKNPLCNSCLHRKICKYSYKFNGFASNLLNVINNFDNKDNPFDVSVHCKFFAVGKNEYFGTRAKE